MSQVKEVIVQGLWKNNSALVQLLGMCPLLAVTSTATNALGLGLATTLVLTLTNLSISALRRVFLPCTQMLKASTPPAASCSPNTVNGFARLTCRTTCPVLAAGSLITSSRNSACSWKPNCGRT